ncbi:MAG: Preprotein translocase subunit E [Candidatus Daviesbacteria bacterium GW2011_GWA1_41_61]|uniref:Protein translocase subunit SecE n=1 Tax=Candidatus Daviesbacteria bacterium GW2011_GWA2_40_9 TaxID=1618424 RepID=A0A0G0U3K3_9BACT|nr:MAG: Preprotein translocase subunit E [Candidatus Daviesbacteria bacterium GW2011_GWC1_40_9]KKR83629.1 MAG: Preprotein translocase subunit E [Candidatus Daviesbacteria bacterium GW2011_GWA2_40_9]KKR92712.1 MAG: Preprotein translocase subunit E [Candidatus Daviesbacteria bacterium GW2011_GWB1_41_15]KKS14643.1 MAG: Preprotein translocase subunit E [Candidatus Daviesbacteria bacterium GW2011_GWA1_41_61]
MSKILDFLTEVRVELSKVVWPTPNQAIRLTVIVIMVTITVGFFIGAVDYLLTKALELVLK